MGRLRGLRRGSAVLMAGCVACAALGAQEAEPASLGFQIRGDLPFGDLRNAVGGGLKPGAGVSLVMEQDFLEGLRGRVSLGGDLWLKGRWQDRPGVDGSMSAVHLSVECVRMLRPDADPPLLGPYVLAGLGIYAWSLASTDTVTSLKTTQQVTHAAASFGFGWRLSPHQDLEVKAVAGKVNPDFTAVTLTAGITFRY